MKLTKPQQDFLEDADLHTPPHERAIRLGTSGMSAKGARIKTADKLCELGLLQYIGHCVIVDEPQGQNWPTYAITDAGRDHLNGD